MPHKNIKTLLVDATKIPAAIEERLPAGAPKLSTTLVNTAAGLPDFPDFPMAVPDLPAPPGIPEMPTGLKRFVTEVSLTPQGEKVTPPAPPAPALRTQKSRLVFE